MQPSPKTEVGDHCLPAGLSGAVRRRKLTIDQFNRVRRIHPGA